MDPDAIRSKIREYARAAYIAAISNDAGEQLAGVEQVCDGLATHFYLAGYREGRDAALTQELQRPRRWDDPQEGETL
jgi:hypothetical protein